MQSIRDFINECELFDDREKAFWAEILILMPSESQEEFRSLIVNHKNKSSLKSKHAQQWKDFVKNESDKTLQVVQNKIKEIEDKRLEEIRAKLDN